jgi:hypothetical protein
VNVFISLFNIISISSFMSWDGFTISDATSEWVDPWLTVTDTQGSTSEWVDPWVSVTVSRNKYLPVIRFVSLKIGVYEEFSIMSPKASDSGVLCHRYETISTSS